MIKFIIFDFDGVFNNGNIIFDDMGNIIKTYNTKDGVGLTMLRDNGFILGVISGYKHNNSQQKILEHLNFKYISLETINKLDKLKEWCKELNITLDEVAYMGDDINDLEVMKHVKVAGCPKDAHNDCLELANFISTKNGGELCVREFCEYILKIKERFEAKVTAVIPIRAGSSRCKDKSIRKWGNTNLLQHKIDVLKKCKYIDEIMVNTNSDNVIEIAKKNNVLYHKRDEYLCMPNSNMSSVFVNWANIDTDIFVYCSATAPFVSSDIIDKIIVFWKYNPKYEVVTPAKPIKKFLFNNGYINTDPMNVQQTQDLENIFYELRGEICAVAYKEYILKNKTLLADKNNMYIYDIDDDINCIDIDYNYDFLLSELLYKNKLISDKLIDDYMLNYTHVKTMVLDCTIRDTGHLNGWNWTYDTVKDFVYYMGEIGIDYCEIGLIRDKKYIENNVGIWRHLNDNLDIIKKLKKETNTKCKIAVMYLIEMPHEEYYDPNMFPNNKESCIDMIRVTSFIETYDKAKKVCNILKDKGYIVTLNIVLCAHLEDNEINMIKQEIIDKKINIDFLYFADSGGLLLHDDIQKIIINMKEIYPVKFGFHNHNNHGTVFSNVICAIDNNIDIIDATISGFGKNGGNMNLEQLIMYLIIKKGYQLKIEPLLEFLEQLKDVDFGYQKIDIYEIKLMLQQFLGIHSSYLKKHINKNILDIYKELINHLHKNEYKKYFNNDYIYDKNQIYDSNNYCNISTI